MKGPVRYFSGALALGLLFASAVAATYLMDEGWSWGSGIGTILIALAGIDLMKGAWHRSWEHVVWAVLLMPD